MNSINFMQSFESIENLLEKFDGFDFRDVSSLLEILLKVSAIAEF